MKILTIASFTLALLLCDRATAQPQIDVAAISAYISGIYTSSSFYYSPVITISGVDAKGQVFGFIDVVRQKHDSATNLGSSRNIAPERAAAVERVRYAFAPVPESNRAAAARYDGERLTIVFPNADRYDLVATGTGLRGSYTNKANSSLSKEVQFTRH